MKASKVTTSRLHLQAQLYRRGHTLKLLKYIGQDQVALVMAEVHVRACNNHLGGRSLAAKIPRAGYFWPTTRSNCAQFVKTYDKCHKFSEVPHKSLEPLHCSETCWPFHRWGINLIGTFLSAHNILNTYWSLSITSPSRSKPNHCPQYLSKRLGSLFGRNQLQIWHTKRTC